MGLYHATPSYLQYVFVVNCLQTVTINPRGKIGDSRSIEWHTWFWVPAEIQQLKSSSLSPRENLSSSVTWARPKCSAAGKEESETLVLLSTKLWMKSSSVDLRAKPPKSSMSAAWSAREPGADCREGCAEEDLGKREEGGGERPLLCNSVRYLRVRRRWPCISMGRAGKGERGRGGKDGEGGWSHDRGEEVKKNCGHGGAERRAAGVSTLQQHKGARRKMPRSGGPVLVRRRRRRRRRLVLLRSQQTRATEQTPGDTGTCSSTQLPLTYHLHDWVSASLRLTSRIPPSVEYQNLPRWVL